MLLLTDASTTCAEAIFRFFNQRLGYARSDLFDLFLRMFSYISRRLVACLPKRDILFICFSVS